MALEVNGKSIELDENGNLVAPPLAFEILEEIEKILPGYPIVLHGSSSVPQEYVDLINENGGALKEAVGISEDQLRRAEERSYDVAVLDVRDGTTVAVTDDGWQGWRDASDGGQIVLNTDGEPIWRRSIAGGRCARVAWARVSISSK